LVYSFIFKVSKRFSLWLVMLTLAALLPASLGSSTAQAADPPPIQGWQDTGFDTSNSKYKFCFDATQPDTLLFVQQSILGTYSYNLNTKRQSLISPASFTTCNQTTGQLYQQPDDDGFGYPGTQPTTGFVLSSREPNLRTIAHFPTHLAQDGTLQLYALNQNSATDWKLYASPDNGYNWQERTQPFMSGPTSVSLKVSPVDGRAIYALAIYGRGVNNPLAKYVIYFSPDAGATWEKRQEKAENKPGELPDALISVLSGNTTPTNMLELHLASGYSGSHGGSIVYTSNDGARTFNQAGARDFTFGIDLIHLSHTNEGIVKFNGKGDTSDNYFNLTLSTDGGKSWQPLPLPTNLPYESSHVYPYLSVVPNAPNNIVLSDISGDNTWLSSDGGHNWRKIGSGGVQPQFISPYLPLTILGQKDHKLYKLDVPDVGKSMTSAALPSGAAGSNYYLETRHNLSGIFKKFWEANGGLAQFGYPKTEPFREYNPADGKVYLAQYFERNRFEYHPDLAGTPYEVLLGLLGNQLTADRKAKGDGAFNYFADMHYPGGRYFPETGHNLRNSFKAYWETNGGLSIYGNPTSEEFYEVNPDDGKTYVVQYFERNRMEWHPENKGTRYEVLLGLLGNTLLQQKGWL